MNKTHTIDANNKVLGRLATEIAILIRGKHKPDFVLNKDMGDIVIVKNAAQMKITGKKLKNNVYRHYSGYPGGLKEVKMGELFEKNPGEVLRKAVYGMLPKNKLRAKCIKRLRIE